ncbi:hypothetical protein BU26DRAFT_597778 [Trematosphaeria pertusa]|uniref:Uncharacterized protein n=1 Tax=Trematosphaeria pertusa TaxID=390896 RepID=A0A6A6IC41_9PLEO|nr:uncharacterized protein BU26DRAFT_597778 [Trematosphaeria pertusa]KAF2247777.1 hypothetical protein BU26DRAFT_597778 [Trematosphaeria pertusa]
MDLPGGVALASPNVSDMFIISGLRELPAIHCKLEFRSTKVWVSPAEVRGGKDESRQLGTSNNGVGRQPYQWQRDWPRAMPAIRRRERVWCDKERGPLESADDEDVRNDTSFEKGRSSGCATEQVGLGSRRRAKSRQPARIRCSSREHEKRRMTSSHDFRLLDPAGVLLGILVHKSVPLTDCVLLQDPDRVAVFGRKHMLVSMHNPIGQSTRSARSSDHFIPSVYNQNGLVQSARGISWCYRAWRNPVVIACATWGEYKTMDFARW